MTQFDCVMLFALSRGDVQHTALSGGREGTKRHRLIHSRGFRKREGEDSGQERQRVENGSAVKCVRPRVYLMSAGTRETARCVESEACDQTVTLRYRVSLEGFVNVAQLQPSGDAHWASVSPPAVCVWVEGGGWG